MDAHDYIIIKLWMCIILYLYVRQLILLCVYFAVYYDTKELLKNDLIS